jgi:hypothetical protein
MRYQLLFGTMGKTFVIHTTFNEKEDIREATINKKYYIPRKEIKKPF